MSLEGGLALSRLCVPQPRRLVFAAGEDAIAVGTERHAVHRTGVAREGEKFLAPLGVPHLRRLVPTAREDAPAVAAEGHVTYLVRVPGEGELVLALQSGP